jgi:glycosyltransferase involved in cell wall biosynthesis
MGASNVSQDSTGRELRRVLFVCSTLAVGGAEKQWSLLIPRLRGRYDISILTLVTEGRFFQELRRQGIQASCAQMRHRFDFRGLRRALRHAEFRPDLVVTHSIDADVVGQLIARRARAAHVTTHHSGPGLRSRVHRKALGRLVGPRVDATIAISDLQVPRLIALGHRPVSIKVIRNAAATPAPKAPAMAVREDLGFGPEQFVAILVATMRPEKAAHVFVEAVRTANRENPRIRGLIAGGGPELGRLEQLTSVDNVVRVLGERDDVADLFAAANVACLSSTREGLPMSLLEAMALGKPVIATEVGGVAEIVDAGNTGLLVPVGDYESFAKALLRLAADPALARALGEAGRQRQRELFSLDRMVAAYEQAFGEVLDAREHRHRAGVRRPGEGPTQP